MNKDEVISALSVENLSLKKTLKDIREIARDAYMKFICVGRGPFNDNTLGFTMEHLSYLRTVLDAVETIQRLASEVAE